MIGLYLRYDATEKNDAIPYSLITGEILRTVLRPVISEIGGNLNFSLLRAQLSRTAREPFGKNKTPTAPATRLAFSDFACSSKFRPTESCVPTEN